MLQLGTDYLGGAYAIIVNATWTREVRSGDVTRGVLVIYSYSSEQG